MLSVGAILDERYELTDELGQGGFSRVYRARQLTTNQDVAIKVISPPPVSEETMVGLRKRFMRETHMCASLNHPHIVRLLDAGEADGDLLFSVFEYIRGHDLAYMLTHDGPMDIEEVGHLMAQLLDALGAAHERGILHRDLKPANIMVSAGGTRRNATILDFGVGTLLAEPSGEWLARVSLSGEFLGTPLYAAPEQIRGQTVTPASDLYAWGLVFLECILGQPVIRGNNITDIIFNQLSDNPVTIPGSLQFHPVGQLLRWVTAKSPEARPSSAAEVMQPLLEIDFKQVKKDLERLGATHQQLDSGDSIELPMRRRALGNAPTPVAGFTPWQPDEGECRLVSVVSCLISVISPSADMVSLDQYDEALQAHFRRCREVAHRYGGTLEVINTEEVLLCFGLPVSREREYLQAARAARALLRPGSEAPSRGGRRTDRPPRLERRIGVHVGMVISRGKAGAEGSSREAMIGLPPIFARRLAARAEGGSALMSAEMAHLVQRTHETTPAGKSVIDPGRAAEEVYSLGSRRHDASTLAARFGVDANPVVGQASVLSLLREQWDRARAGSCRTLVLHGGMGLGKSRLCWELAQEVAGQDRGYIEIVCKPETRKHSLLPISRMVRRLVGVLPDDLPQLRRSRLHKFLTARGFELHDVEALFAPLVGLRPDDALPPLGVSMEGQQQLTLDALISLVHRMCQEHPTLLVCDDLHWADDATLDWLASLISESAAEPLCAIFTARSGFAPPWAPSETTQISLEPLDREDAAAVVAAVAGPGMAPEGAMLHELLRRADGVPLFLEELARQAALQLTRVAGGHGHADQGPAGAEIPAAVRDLLTARLDAVGPARETAGLVAALGEEAIAELLGTISPLNEATLRIHLDALVEAGIIRSVRIQDRPGHAFTHPMLAECAYTALARSRRRRLHAQIAASLETEFPELLERDGALLVRHLTEAGLTQRARRLRDTLRFR